MSNQNNNSAFQMIADIDGDLRDFLNVSTPEHVPVLALRNTALFPGVVPPILIGRKSSKTLVEKAEKKGLIIGVVSQRDPDVDSPTKEDLFTVGVYAKVMKLLTLPNGNVTAIVQGLGRLELDDITSTSPYLEGDVTPLEEIQPEKKDREFNAAVSDLRDLVNKYIGLSEEIPDEANYAIKNISNPVMMLNFVCTNMLFNHKDKQKLLEAETVKERLFMTMKLLNREINLLNLKAEIRNKTREDIDEQQRNYFLQQQIKNMQAEMGHGESYEKMELLRKARPKKWSYEMSRYFYKECDKLDNQNPQSPEYNVQLTYLQTLVNLPWGEFTEDDLDLKRAQRILDKDHYGMEKVKERILEYMAVLSLRGDLKSPILCLYGPPGVGKTSLGKSIAAAMKRKYVRVSLGGVHDEAEIRGHRRTYIGAMPGRIIKSIQKAGSSNPVFILDEIDKVTQNTHNGDPASALLEVLDPEQNNAFHDNYLDVDYDLSKVLFIATANNLSTIPRPLLDRMEIIDVSGYITEEKIEIANREYAILEKNETRKSIEGFKKPMIDNGTDYFIAYLIILNDLGVKNLNEIDQHKKEIDDLIDDKEKVIEKLRIMGKGRKLEDKKMFDEAIETYMQLKTYPHKYEAYRRVCICYRKKRDYYSEIILLDKLINDETIPKYHHKRFKRRLEKLLKTRPQYEYLVNTE